MELVYPGKLDRTRVMTETPSAGIKQRTRFGSSDTNAWVNQLYQGDNLPILKTLYEDPSIRGKVQLVYIDPPYASKQTFRHRKRIGEDAYSDNMGGPEFVEFLRGRLILLREILADDGAIYVHLDSNMAFHMKVIMDEVFGERQFQNWITRKKCHSKNYTRKNYGNVADYILFYSKSQKMKWNRPYEKENIYTFEQRFPKVDPETGRRHALVPIHAPGVRNGETGKPWKGMMPPPGKHWQVIPSELDRLDAAGEIYWSPTGNPRRKIFADNDNGVPVQDIWTKFMDFRNQNMKETGYPTEKNSALLRRIIEASSDPGDIVLDCFCGSGSSLAVAHDLGRRWIGVDESDLAIKTTVERLTSGAKARPPEPAEQLMLFDRHESDQEIKNRFDDFDLLVTATNESSVRSASVPAS
jgi:adenine-specific DNA-methyltransferase